VLTSRRTEKPLKRRLSRKSATWADGGLWIKSWFEICCLYDRVEDLDRRDRCRISGAGW